MQRFLMAVLFLCLCAPNAHAQWSGGTRTSKSISTTKLPLGGSVTTTTTTTEKQAEEFESKFGRMRVKSDGLEVELPSLTIHGKGEQSSKNAAWLHELAIPDRRDQHLSAIAAAERARIPNVEPVFVERVVYKDRVVLVDAPPVVVQKTVVVKEPVPYPVYVQPFRTYYPNGYYTWPRVDRYGVLIPCP